jgi:hypothetical protein
LCWFGEGLRKGKTGDERPSKVVQLFRMSISVGQAGKMLPDITVLAETLHQLPSIKLPRLVAAIMPASGYNPAL